MILIAYLKLCWWSEFLQITVDLIQLSKITCSHFLSLISLLYIEKLSWLLIETRAISVNWYWLDHIIDTMVNFSTFNNEKIEIQLQLRIRKLMRNESFFVLDFSRNEEIAILNWWNQQHSNSKPIMIKWTHRARKIMLELQNI